MNDVRKRLESLNTKAYYLLVAFSFLYFRQQTSPTVPFKLALTLTSVAAILPVQDFLSESDVALECARWAKVSLLFAALLFTVWWIWAGHAAWILGTAAGLLCILLVVFFRTRRRPDPQQGNPAS